MKIQWFTRKGIFYKPASAAGWIIMLAAIGYAVYAFIDINRRSDSIAPALLNFVFYLLIIGLAYTLIAFFTEKRQPAESTAD